MQQWGDGCLSVFLPCYSFASFISLSPSLLIPCFSPFSSLAFSHSLLYHSFFQSPLCVCSLCLSVSLSFLSLSLHLSLFPLSLSISVSLVRVSLFLSPLSVLFSPHHSLSFSLPLSFSLYTCPCTYPTFFYHSHPPPCFPIFFLFPDTRTLLSFPNPMKHLAHIAAAEHRISKVRKRTNQSVT